MANFLHISCREWLETARLYPREMEVVMEMMIAAHEELCG